MARLEELRTIRLGVAATLIQKNALRWLYQKKYKRTRACIIFSQKMVRGYLGRKHARAFIKQRKSAIKIQASLKAFAKMQKYRRIRKSCVPLQAVLARRYVQPRFRTFVTLTTNAQTLQTVMRNSSQRALFETMRSGIALAQSACLGHLARSQNLVSMAKINSAQGIQRWLRARLAINAHARKRRASSLLKSASIRRRVRTSLGICRKAACLLEGILRRLRPRRNLASHAASVIAHRDNVAALLQSRYRSKRLRTLYIRRRRCACKLEACVRGHRARFLARRLRRNRDAASVIKSVAHRSFLRRHLGALLCHLVVCQALIRRKILRKRKLALSSHVRNIQRMIRRVKPRIAYVAAWKKLVKIEAVYKGHLARRRVDHLLHPTKVRRNEDMMREIVALRPRGTRVNKELLDREYRQLRRVQDNINRVHSELKKKAEEREERRRQQLERQVDKARYTEYEASQLASRLAKAEEKLAKDALRMKELEEERAKMIEKQSDLEQDLEELAKDAAAHTVQMYEEVKSHRDRLETEVKDLKLHLNAELEMRTTMEKDFSARVHALEETQAALLRAKEHSEELEAKEKALRESLQSETRSHKTFELKAADLEERNHKLELELAEMRETAKRLQLSDIQLKTAVSDAQNNREDLEKNLEELRITHEQVLGELHREMEERQALELARDNREATIESLQSKLELANQAKADALGMLEPLQQSIDDLQSRLQRDGNDRKDIERRFREATRERELTERKLELELKSKEHIKQEHTELTRRVAELELALETRSGPRAKFGHLLSDEEKAAQERNQQMIVEALEAQIDQLKGDCDLLSRKLDMERDAQQQSELERMELLSKIATLEAQVTTMSEVRQRSAADISALREAREEAAHAYQQLAVERGQRAALEARLNRLEVEEQLADRSRELDPVITTLRRERDELSARVQSLQPLISTVGDLREQLSEAHEREFQMRKEVQQANNNLAMIEHKHKLEVESLERDTRRSSSKELALTTSESECQRLRQQVALLEAEQTQRMEMDRRRSDPDFSRQRLEEENIRLASRVQILEAEMRSNIEESVLMERQRADELRADLEQENYRLRGEVEMLQLEKRHRQEMEASRENSDTDLHRSRTDAEVLRLRSQVQLLQAELANRTAMGTAAERSETDMARIAQLEAECIRLRGQSQVLELEKKQRLELDQKRGTDDEQFSSALEAENVRLRSTLALLESEARNRSLGAGANGSSNGFDAAARLPQVEAECAELRVQLQLLTMEGKHRVDLISSNASHDKRVGDYAMANTEAECNRLRALVTRLEMENRSLRDMSDANSIKGGLDQECSRLRAKLQTTSQELATARAIAEEWEENCRRLTARGGVNNNNNNSLNASVIEMAELERRLLEAERENQLLARKLALSGGSVDVSGVDSVRLEQEVEEWKRECQRLWSMLAARGVSRADMMRGAVGVNVVSASSPYALIDPTTGNTMLVGGAGAGVGNGECCEQYRLALERETEAKMVLEREKNILVVQMEVLKGNLMMQSEMLRLAQDDRAFNSLQITQELDQAKSQLKQEVADRTMLERRLKEIQSDKDSASGRLNDLRQQLAIAEQRSEEVQEERLRAVMQVVELEAKLQAVAKTGGNVPERAGMETENQQLRKRLQEQLKTVTMLQDDKRKLTLEVTRLRRTLREGGASADLLGNTSFSNGNNNSGNASMMLLENSGYGIVGDNIISNNSNDSPLYSSPQRLSALNGRSGDDVVIETGVL